MENHRQTLQVEIITLDSSNLQFFSSSLLEIFQTKIGEVPGDTSNALLEKICSFEPQQYTTYLVVSWTANERTQTFNILALAVCELPTETTSDLKIKLFALVGDYLSEKTGVGALLYIQCRVLALQEKATGVNISLLSSTENFQLFEFLKKINFQEKRVFANICGSGSNCVTMRMDLHWEIQQRFSQQILGTTGVFGAGNQAIVAIDQYWKEELQRTLENLEVRKESVTRIITKKMIDAQNQVEDLVFNFSRTL